jgi:hypothetical protein
VTAFYRKLEYQMSVEGGKKQMRKLCVMTTCLMLTIGSAVAQSGNSGKRPEPLPAPVGHRQPRADQVPTENSNSAAAEAEKKQDAELDRKIKSICRGC